MADKIPSNFNRQAFKEALAYVESGGGKFLENKTSSAVGKYQFLWKYIQHDPSLKGVTKREFIDSPELQEQIMDSALNGTLKGFPNYIENARKLKSEFNSSLRVDEIALLTHFLGSGGVREQLQSGAYEVPGQNMSVDGYTGKYNKYLQEMGLNGGNSLVQDVPRATNNTQEEIPQTEIQQDTQEDPYNLVERGSRIGMDNPPYASEPQRDPFREAQDLGGVQQEMQSIRPELRVTVEDDVAAFRGYMDQNQQAFEAQELMRAQENAPVDPRKVQRIKNMLSPGKEGSGYGEEFENTQDPTMNIVDNNSFAYGGYTKQNRYVDGGDPTDPPKEKLVSSTTGDTVTNTSYEQIKNEDGLSGIRRTINKITPNNQVFETPDFTPEGNAAYAALTQDEKDAQDAKWRKMHGQNTTSESDDTFFLNPLEAEDINLRGMAGETELPQIGDAAQYQEPKRDPLYYIYGNSIPNSKFGGHESYMITSDGSIKNDISHVLSPGDISKDSPISGERNIAIHRQLTEAEQDAAETNLGQSWFRPIPEDIGNEMIKRQKEGEAEIERRNLNQHNQTLANMERVEANQAADATERSQRQAQMQAQMQARKEAKTQADAEKAAQKQAVIDSRENNSMANGGMIKRADGSYSKRGLWDNIRANRGSGKRPTKSMLEQERKINKMAEGGQLSCGGPGQPPCDENYFKQIRESRGGEETYVINDGGKNTFHKNPQYKNHEPSTHLMSDDGENHAWPSIRKNSEGNWEDQNEMQAKQNNEYYTFKNEEEARNFARKGSWKGNKMAEGGNLNTGPYGGSVDTEDSENFTEFKGGGTHEENSLGGIPQGMGDNGKLNTVEEGETKVNIDGEDYIFSQRGRLDGTGFDSSPSTNKFFGGGPIPPVDPSAAAKGGGNGMGVASAAVGGAGMILDAFDKPKEVDPNAVAGLQDSQKSVGMGAAKGALSGAAAGASAGPIGMAIGAGVGLIGGGLSTIFGNKKAQEENVIAYAQANPALRNQNYNGGYLKKKKSTKKSRVKRMLRNK